MENQGTGTAFNIMSVLYGPESVVLDFNTRTTDLNNHHWTCLTDSLAVGESKECVYQQGGSTFFQGQKHLGKYSLNALPQPFIQPMDQEPTYLCRVTTTYHDIFRRKHASIFDLDINGNWTMRACLENIKQDLHDLEGSKNEKKGNLAKTLVTLVCRTHFNKMSNSGWVTRLLK